MPTDESTNYCNRKSDDLGGQVQGTISVTDFYVSTQNISVCGTVIVMQTVPLLRLYGTWLK